MAVPVTAAVPETSDSFTWNFPGAPVRVVLSLAAVERLASDVSAGGSFAGVLFGRRMNTAVHVSDYYRVKDESPGPWVSAGAGAWPEAKLRTRWRFPGFYRIATRAGGREAR
jgi:hypothetical protein